MAIHKSARFPIKQTLTSYPRDHDGPTTVDPLPTFAIGGPPNSLNNNSPRLSTNPQTESKSSSVVEILRPGESSSSPVT